MSALASFGELARSVGVGTCVVGALWGVVILGIGPSLDRPLGASQLSVMPPIWFSHRHVLAFVAGLVAIDVVLIVGGLSRTAAAGISMPPLIAFMWYMISVIIDGFVTDAIKDTTSTQPEVHA